MAGSTYESLTAEQKLRLTLQKDVKAICEEVCSIMNVEVHSFAIDLITELLWKRLQLYAVDLEHFARHAKRSNINNEDVKLMVRRNPSIKTHVMQFIENNINVAGKESKKKRTTISSIFAGNQASAKNKGGDDVTKNSKASTAKKKDDDFIESSIDLT